MGFEFQRALDIEEEIFREASPVLTKPFVQGVFTHLLEPVADGLEEESGAS